MNGTIFKRKLPSGKVAWGYSIELGRDESGKRLRKFASGFERKSDAEEARRRALNEKHDGNLLKPNPATLGEFLDEWLREYADKKCSPKTVERYRQLADYVRPHVGDVKLQEITALMLHRVFNKLKESGGHNRKTKLPRPLSAKTVRHIAGVVHTALTTAIEWGLLKSNPCITKNLPKVRKREARALEPDQLIWYADAARAVGLYEFLMVAAGTGCRRGELLALTWTDIDLDHRIARVSKSLEQTRQGLRVKETKNQKSRPIPLPASTNRNPSGRQGGTRSHRRSLRSCLPQRPEPGVL
jgi:integrase